MEQIQIIPPYLVYVVEKYLLFIAKYNLFKKSNG